MHSVLAVTCLALLLVFGPWTGTAQARDACLSEMEGGPPTSECFSLPRRAPLAPTRAESIARGVASVEVAPVGPVARVRPVAVAAPVAPAGPDPAGRLVVRSISYQSQLTEPSPPDWKRPNTPYCAAAAALMVLGDFGLASGLVSPLAETWKIGRAGNTTNDPGIDPDGIAALMKTYGGEGRIHLHRTRIDFLDDVVGRLNHGVTVVALTEAGNHAVTVYGYDADAFGSVRALYVADPLRGDVGRVTVERWWSSSVWMGKTFTSPGAQWKGGYIFVTYKDFR